MSKKQRKLLPEEKLLAVRDYLSGKGSTYCIAKYHAGGVVVKLFCNAYG